MRIEEIIENTVTEIRDTTNEIDIAFSGGLDSTLVARLCVDALGNERVRLINISFDRYSYTRSASIVRRVAEDIGLQLFIEREMQLQEEIWRRGPSCNRCTRHAKINTIRKLSDRLIATGANQSDSWGKTGIAIKDGFYAPIRSWDKHQISEALRHYGIVVPKIGESAGREGCKLKHLLKMLINPDFHGKAVDMSNEILLDFLNNRESDIANVKIIGPLSRNIALVNVRPYLKTEEIREVTGRLSELSVIDEVHYMDSPVSLTVAANPAVTNDPESMRWIEEGRLQPEFAVPIKVDWLPSRNRRLDTFHVVDFRRGAM